MRCGASAVRCGASAVLAPCPWAAGGCGTRRTHELVRAGAEAAHGEGPRQRVRVETDQAVVVLVGHDEPAAAEREALGMAELVCKGWSGVEVG